MPVELRHPVERVTLARGVMIKNVFAGQLRDDVGVTAVPAARGSPYLRLVSAHPLEFRPERLAGEALARIGEDRLLAIATAC
jgi:hypothetical protein